MANTMNPVELYHDSSLDGLINQSQSLRISNPMRRKGNGGQDRPSPEGDEMPHAPDVPQGPPISYRGTPKDGNLQRSFSQRAKGRPFAKEAYADGDYHPPPIQPATVRPIPESHRLPASRMSRPSGPDDLRVNTTGQSQNGSGRPRPSDVPPSSISAPPVANGKPSSTTTSYLPPRRDQPASAGGRSSATRTGSATEDQRRDWAPDRSPLQKLEVTLNDISKEEKRARVQEAEMLLRESKARRAASAPVTKPKPSTTTARQGPAYQTTRPSSKAPTIEEAGLVRNLSSMQKSRLQHSIVIDNHRPDPRRLSGEGDRGFEYTVSNSRDTNSNTYPTSPPAAADPVPHLSADPRGAHVQRHRRKEDGFDSGRTLSAQQTNIPEQVGNPVLAKKMRAVSMQDRPRPSRTKDSRDDRDDRSTTLADRERNASHKAALAKLTGVATPMVVAQNEVRKTGEMHAVDLGPPETRSHVPAWPGQQTGMQDDQLERQMATPSDETRAATARTPPQKHTTSRDLTGPGVAPASPTITNLQPNRIAGEQRQRRASVTFQEPAPRRPIDEWKDAKTARLSLADFDFEKKLDSTPDTNKAWWESNPDSKSRRRSKAQAAGGVVGDPIDDRKAEFNPRLYLKCGPLLRYTGMKRTVTSTGTDSTEGEVWRGSVMIVTQDSRSSYQQPPVLRLFSRAKTLLPPPPAEVTDGELAPEYIDPIAGLEKISRQGRTLYVRPVDHLEEAKDLSRIETDDGLFEASPSLLDTNGNAGYTTTATNRRTVAQDGEHVGRFQEVQGCRLYADPDRDVTFWRFNIEVELGNAPQHIAYRINRGASSSFWVPARGETMNIMFHSCNGFSIAVKPDQFSGPDPLWRDVLNVHQTRPFHVMIGGGDQIYNDRVRLETQHFGAWTQIKNPHHKLEAPFSPEMKQELESFYLERYAMWFSQGLFGMAASQIPMVNIWDDHDIIDGFGSYPDHFMKAPVFSGIGNVAFKYYMLFQHQSVPEETTATEPSWVLGHEPGPYIHHLSRSLFMSMGKHVAFLGVDCRTERMRDEVLSIRTFDALLERCRKEITEGETKHLLVLLGVPIAYPRLVWLENVLTSRAFDPIKMLGRAGVLKSGFLNTFDGGVEILDDLDDHWTATHHKNERNDLIKDLQDLAAEKSVRITILGGDVHLAAIGQFYSNPKLRIPKDKDHRYMPNVISSAIVNTPPPDMMADVINKRNKTHHLDKYTDENMIPMFTHDVDHKRRNNVHLLPRRNWCSISEYKPGSTPSPSPPSTPSALSEQELDLQNQEVEEAHRRRFSFSRGEHRPSGLLRKFSSRVAPPSSYKDTMPGTQHRSASYEGSQPLRGGFFGLGRSGSVRASFDSSHRPSSADEIATRPVRPGILRRPTNLSEKAAKKGNVFAIDADGNEIDVNDHINLENGLDIVLNAEVNQKDPAGITTPYRLLVPALWYDGSSDREKLNSLTGVHRRPTLLNRFGIGSKRQQKAAQRDEADAWDEEISDHESDVDGNEKGQKATPRRRFSLFGSHRRKQDDFSSDEDSATEDGPTAPQRFGQPLQASQPPLHPAAPRQITATVSNAARRVGETGQFQGQQQQQPQQQQGAPSKGLSATTPLNAQAPAQRMLAAGYRQPQPSKAVQRMYDTGQMQPPQSQAMPSSHAPDILYDTTNRPSSQHFAEQAVAGRRSLTITSGKTRGPEHHAVGDRYPVQPPPTSNRSLSAQGSPNQFNAPPQPHLQIQSQPSNSMVAPGRQLSKQERILGIGAGNSYEPGSIPLRGSGIIGGHESRVNETSPQGYSGIEAWRDPGKPRRGFSFKKAREWLDGKRQRYSDSYDDENYEDDVGYMERPQPGHGQQVY